MRFRKETAGMGEDNMFLKRLFSTIILLGLFGAAIFAPDPFNKVVFLLLSSLLTFALVREICDIVKNLGMETFKNETALFCMLSVLSLNSIFYMYMYSLMWFGKTFMLFLSLVSTMLFGILITIPLLILFSKNSGEKIKKLFNSIGVSFFVFIPVQLIMGIYIRGTAGAYFFDKINYHFLVFILLTKIGDIGAYVVGTVSNKLIKGGNHKMVPSISPGKSWEGAIGGLIVTVLLALAFHEWMPHVEIVGSLPVTVVTGILMFFGSMAGDLMESALKRSAKVKDSGTTIPGIGGVFDLVDSLFVTAPLFYLIFIYLFIFNFP